MSMTQNEIMEVAKMVASIMNGSVQNDSEVAKPVSKKSKVKNGKSVKSVPANDFDALMKQASVKASVYEWDDDKLTLSLVGYTKGYRFTVSECSACGAVISTDKRSWVFPNATVYNQYKTWKQASIAAYKASKKQSKKSDK